MGMTVFSDGFQAQKRPRKRADREREYFREQCQLEVV